MTQASNNDSHAPRLLRVAAFLLDAMLALLLALGIHLLVRFGLIQEFGAWNRFTEAGLFDAQLLLLALLLVCLRDLPFGSSVAKWLLCLRLVGLRGKPLGWPQRLLRVPFSWIPVALLPGSWQRAFPWTVLTYSPSRSGLFARSGLTAAAATFSVVWAVETIRPSIGADDARRIAAELVATDPLLGKSLGEPLDFVVGRITRRAHQQKPGRQASFHLVVEGQQGHQSMVVHVRKVERLWRLEELRDIQITYAASDSDQVARR